MVVTSVTGHMMEIEFDDAHRKWMSCEPVALFDAPIIKAISDDKKDIARTLRREARACQKLILWLDCDREGENIAFEVIDVCQVCYLSTNQKPHWIPVFRKPTAT